MIDISRGNPLNPVLYSLIPDIIVLRKGGRKSISEVASRYFIDLAAASFSYYYDAITEIIE